MLPLRRLATTIGTKENVISSSLLLLKSNWERVARYQPYMGGGWFGFGNGARVELRQPHRCRTAPVVSPPWFSIVPRRMELQAFDDEARQCLLHHHRCSC